MSKCEVETPYLAGLFDSKGTINFDKLNPDKKLSLKVEINSELAVRFFLEKFGGITRYNSKVCYWLLDDHAQILVALKEMLPFLRVNKQQANLVVSYLGNYEA